MINPKNIKIEYIISALFGILALVLSFLVGVISGNGIILIFQRTLITAIIFSIMGLGCILAIKKFVPEVYQIIALINNNESIEIKAEDLTPNNDKEKNPETNNSPVSDVNLKNEDIELENEFTISEKRPDEYSSLEIKENDSNEISKNILKDKKIKYEPRIAAQAIRTMIKRDE